MATGKIDMPIQKYIPIQGGSLATTSIYDFVRSSSTPQGIYLKDIQLSTDSPFGGGIAQAIILKPTDNGDYSIVFGFGSGSAKVSGQLSPNATAFTWKSVTVT